MVKILEKSGKFVSLEMWEPCQCSETDGFFILIFFFFTYFSLFKVTCTVCFKVRITMNSLCLLYSCVRCTRDSQFIAHPTTSPWAK